MRIDSLVIVQFSIKFRIYVILSRVAVLLGLSSGLIFKKVSWFHVLVSACWLANVNSPSPVQWLKEYIMHFTCFNTKQINFPPIICYIVMVVHLRGSWLDLTRRVECVREQGPMSHISAFTTLLTLVTNMQIPTFSSSIFTFPLLYSLANKSSSLPPSTWLSTLLSSFITSVTQLNIYLPTSACECNFASPTSLSLFVFFGFKPFCTKVRRHAGEGLTSSIPTLPFFSNLVLFALPSASCQDASTSGLPLEKYGQSGNTANNSLQSSKDR